MNQILTTFFLGVTLYNTIFNKTQGQPVDNFSVSAKPRISKDEETEPFEE
jgi:hypothetical protein